MVFPLLLPVEQEAQRLFLRELPVQHFVGDSPKAVGIEVVTHLRFSNPFK